MATAPNNDGRHGDEALVERLRVLAERRARQEWLLNRAYQRLARSEEVCLRAQALLEKHRTERR